MEEHNHEMNMHTVNPEIKIHTVVSEALDFDHGVALRIPLGEVSDDQLLAEVFSFAFVFPLSIYTYFVTMVGCEAQA